MQKELNIKQKIFAEFIKLDLIDEAIKYVRDSGITYEEQVEALEALKKSK